MKDTNERGIETMYQLETLYPLGSLMLAFLIV
jgi:hypothetical protein